MYFVRTKKNNRSIFMTTSVIFTFSDYVVRYECGRLYVQKPELLQSRVRAILRLTPNFLEQLCSVLKGAVLNSIDSDEIGFH